MLLLKTCFQLAVALAENHCVSWLKAFEKNTIESDISNGVKRDCYITGSFVFHGGVKPKQFSCLSGQKGFHYTIYRPSEWA